MFLVSAVMATHSVSESREEYRARRMVEKNLEKSVDLSYKLGMAERSSMRAQAEYERLTKEFADAKNKL